VGGALNRRGIEAVSRQRSRSASWTHHELFDLPVLALLEQARGDGRHDLKMA